MFIDCNYLWTLIQQREFTNLTFHSHIAIDAVSFVFQTRANKASEKCQESCWSRDELPKWLWSHFFGRTLVLRNTCHEQYSNMEENISCMEEECLIEKRRATILKECKEILQEEGSGRYSKEAFRRLFQGQVRIFCLIQVKT